MRDCPLPHGNCPDTAASKSDGEPAAARRKREEGYNSASYSHSLVNPFAILTPSAPTPHPPPPNPLLYDLWWDGMHTGSPRGLADEVETRAAGRALSGSGFIVI